MHKYPGAQDHIFPSLPLIFGILSSTLRSLQTRSHWDNLVNTWPLCSFTLTILEGMSKEDMYGCFGIVAKTEFGHLQKGRFSVSKRITVQPELMMDLASSYTLSSQPVET